MVAVPLVRIGGRWGRIEFWAPNNLNILVFFSRIFVYYCMINVWTRGVVTDTVSAAGSGHR